MKNSNVQKSVLVFFLSLIGLLALPGCSRKDDVLEEIGVRENDPARLGPITDFRTAQANVSIVGDYLPEEPKKDLDWVYNQTRIEVAAIYLKAQMKPFYGKKIAMMEILQTIAVNQKIGAILPGKTELRIHNLVNHTVKFSYRLQFFSEEFQWENQGMASMAPAGSMKLEGLAGFRGFTTNGQFKVEVLDLIVVDDATVESSPR